MKNKGYKYEYKMTKPHTHKIISKSVRLGVNTFGIVSSSTSVCAPQGYFLCRNFSRTLRLPFTDFPVLECTLGASRMRQIPGTLPLMPSILFHDEIPFSS